MKRIPSVGRLSAAPLVVIVVLLVLAPGAWTQSNYKTLHKFAGGNGGARPAAGLTFDQAGTLYGTTSFGGDNNSGTIFKLTPNSDGSWEKSILYSFCSLTNCRDGADPYARLMFDAAGNLYGTTEYGGNLGDGAVFMLTPELDGSWAESVLYSFCSAKSCDDGADPHASVIFDPTGNLYGTTINGGGGKFGPWGTVFKLTPNSDGSWTESVIYSFCSLIKCSDGAFPSAELIVDRAGNLYGTTTQGGNPSCDYGCGVVFKLTQNSEGGWTESVLYSFCSLTKCRDGEDSAAGLIFDTTGNLYGTTVYGGAHGTGTVFELTQNSNGTWKEQVLHSFRGRDGLNPFNGVIFDAVGNLYGTTNRGGKAGCDELGCGVVFKLAPKSNGGWTETVLHTFIDHPGADPAGGVIFDQTELNLYGATNGDSFGTTWGSVFEITP
jgi:uncharacterized repeat protein (TIGR03803 family)